MPCTVIRSDQVHLSNGRRLSPFLKLSHSPIEEKEQRHGNPYCVDTWRNSGTAASSLLFLVLVHIAASEVQALTKNLSVSVIKNLSKKEKEKRKKPLRLCES